MPTKPERRSTLKQFWPLWSSVLLYLAVVATQLCVITLHRHDPQIYALDDPYIHAAVAKNLILHHVYGATPYQTSFPSSSILWPFLLAAVFTVMGVHSWVMFGLNVLIAIVYLAAAYFFLRQHAPTLPTTLQALLLILLIFVVPLQLLTFIGMEHILHALLFLLLLWSYTNARRPAASHTATALFLLTTFLITAVRYEGLFAIAILCPLLAVRRHWRLAFAAAIAAAIPPTLFGLFAVRKGSTFLPSPLLLKTAESHLPWYLAAAHTLFSRQSITGGTLLIFILTAAALFFLRRPRGPSQPQFDWLILFFGTFLLHVQFARFGWLFRYEAYLLATGLVLLFAAIPLLQTQSPKLAFWLPAVLIAGFIGRAAVLLPLPITQAHLVSEQQYQTALFLRRFYSGHSVALNDIGAPSFFADIHCLDLYGLSSPEVQHLRATGRFDRDAINQLAIMEHAEIAILYDQSFTGMIPATWTPVSRWIITDMPATSLFGPDTITFYAIGFGQVQQLNQRIRDFEPSLPATVKYTNLIANEEPRP